MALTIKNPETDQIARELVNLTGEGLTQAIDIALKERLQRIHKSKQLEERKARIEDQLGTIHANQIAPVLTDDDLYDESGLPR